MVARLNPNSFATGIHYGNLTYLNVMEDLDVNQAELEDQIWHRRFGHVSNTRLKKMKCNEGSLQDEWDTPRIYNPTQS